jgi:hypothetical protein
LQTAGRRVSVGFKDIVWRGHTRACLGGHDALPAGEPAEGLVGDLGEREHAGPEVDGPEGELKRDNVGAVPNQRGDQRNGEPL